MKGKHPHAGHGFTHTHVDIHDDGSASIHHVHADGPEHDVKHAVADLDGVHESFQKHLNPDEVESKIEKSGQDPEALEEKVSPGIHQKIAEMAEDK